MTDFSYDASRHLKKGRGKVYDSIVDTIGDTPLVRLPRRPAPQARPTLDPEPLRAWGLATAWCSPAASTWKPMAPPTRCVCWKWAKTAAPAVWASCRTPGGVGVVHADMCDAPHAACSDTTAAMCRRRAVWPMRMARFPCRTLRCTSPQRG